MDKIDVCIYDQKSKFKIDRKIYGHFIEKLCRCISGGILYKGKLNSKLIEIIKQIKPSMIRFPGGCFADGYHWKDEIGPLKKRKKIYSPAWNEVVDNNFGTDEYLELCNILEAEPHITVNVGSGSSSEAAEWVKYCNIECLKKGGPKVNYWSIGNELWAFWEIGFMNSSNYIKVVKEFVSKMKAVDPEIKIIIAGSRKHVNPKWNREVLSELGSLIDYLSYHVYIPTENPGEEDEINRSSPQCYKSIVASFLHVKELLEEEEETINSLGLRNKVAIALDEFNVWYPGYGRNRNNFEIDYNIEQAIYYASLFHMMFKKSDLIKIACQSSLTNVMGLIKVNDKNQFTLSPGYFVYVIYANYSGNYCLKTEYNNFYFKSNDLVDIPAYDKVPVLDITSTIDEDNKKVYIHIINRDIENSYRVKINFKFQSFVKFNEKIVRRTIKCNDFRDFNYPDINNIDICDSNIKTSSLRNLLIYPHSIDNIEVGYILKQ